MRLTEKEYEALLAQGVHSEIVHNAPPLPNVGKEKGSKYGARKTEVDGIRFDSASEARRYQALKLLESVGEISNLELQPEFVLQEAFTHNGRKFRAIKYKADFRYITKDGLVVVEDVKGVETPVFKLKWKMLLHNVASSGATQMRFVVVKKDKEQYG